VTDRLRRNANLVESLGGALRDGGHALSAVPGLLKQVLAEEGWREFVTQRGERVEHQRFEDFITVPPLKGLGATVELVERVIGTSDPDLLRLWREARKGRQGRPRKGEIKPVDSTAISDGAERSSLTVGRLARDAPEEYEAVRRGEKTIHRAARDAGIRPHRISVRLDRPESIARSLRRHMTSDQLAALGRMLVEG
jgi:hypothetical protein